MKHRVEFTAGNLRDALAIAAPFIERRSNIPLLACVLIDATKAGGALIVANNLDCEIEVPCPASVEGPGFSVAVEARHLKRIVSLIPRETVVTIEREIGDNDGAERVTLLFPGARYALISLPAHDFQRLGFDMKGAEGIRLQADAFRAAIKRLWPMICTQETRYYLNGVCVFWLRDKLQLVATDGHRLAATLFPHDGKALSKPPEGGPIAGRPILPRFLLQRILAERRILPKQILFGAGTSARINCVGGIRIVSKLIDGSFPDVAKVLPEVTPEYRTFSVSRGRLALALKRMSAALATSGNGYARTNRPAVFRFTNSGLYIAGDFPEVLGSAEFVPLIDAPAIGEDFEVGFNVGYILDLLQTVHAGDAGPFQFVCKASHAPVLCPSDKAEAVQMPLRSRSMAEALPDYQSLGVAA